MTNPSAFNQAWQEFQKANTDSFLALLPIAPNPQREYLYNRLWLAFRAGWNAGERDGFRQGKAELAEKLVAALEKERG